MMTDLHSPETASETPRVILATWPATPLARELILALAARGHSLVIWLAWAGGSALAEDALDLQLEISRTGGISLAHESDDLTAAAEAFGRIDLGLAASAAEVGAMARAAAALDRDRRPGRILMLTGNGEPAAVRPLAAEDMASVDVPPGVKLFSLGTAGFSPAELAARFSVWL